MTARVTKRAVANNEINNYQLKAKKGGQSSFYIGLFMTARVTKRAVANNEINNYRLKARKRAGSHLFTLGSL